MIKLVLTGPESTGKTTLARELASKLGCGIVPEFSRQFLEKLNRPYREEDLKWIAEGQLLEEARIALPGRPLVICDTDLLVIKVWGEIRFRQYPKLVDQFFETEQVNRFYLLCYPDIPWEPDPLRENPNDREFLFQHYLKELQTGKHPYGIVRGLNENRLQNALDILSRQLGLTFLKKG